MTFNVRGFMPRGAAFDLVPGNECSPQLIRGTVDCNQYPDLVCLLATAAT